MIRAFVAVPAHKLARNGVRLPLEMQAEAMLAALPEAQLVDVSGETTFSATIARRTSRHAWSLGAAEQLVLQAIIAGRGVRTAFEIGTFNGGTTRVLAEAVPEDGVVTTIDLPPVAFDASQGPAKFSGSMVGDAYQDSPSAHKVEQLFGNSLEFDIDQFAGRYDLVLVDGGHEYEHGVADTKTALRLLAPGGIIVWDDFAAYWHGLVRGICQAMEGRNLSRLSGTAFGVYVDGRSGPSDGTADPTSS